MSANRGRGRLTAGLVMMITLAAFEALATSTIMPAVKDDLGEVRLYGWVFSAFLLASLVGITFAGEQADRYGPGRPYAIGLVLFATGLLIAGLAPSMEVLVAGRLVQGLGGGAIPPVAYVAVARAYREDERPRMLALFSTAWVVPGLIGPALAGAGAEYLHWRVVFLAILPLVAAAALLTLPALRRIGPPEAGTVAVPGRSRVPLALLLAAGAGLLLAALTLRSPWMSPLLGVPGFAAALYTAKRLAPRGTLRAAPGLPAAIVGIGALNWAFFSVDAFVPYMLTEVRGTSTVVAGLAITSASLSWAAGTWIVERRANMWSRAAFVRTGMLLLLLGIVAIVPVLSQQVPFAWTIVAWAVAGLGIGLAYPNFSLVMLSSADPEEIGAASAATKLAEALAAGLGAGVAGAIIAGGEHGGWVEGSLALAFGVACVLAIGGALLAARLPSGSAAGDPGAAAAASPAGGR